ncbi:MAG: C10 family peptidase [Bacteroidetes bacterium]|nr:C10 family peptidase [Bacteroidota bacterium]
MKKIIIIQLISILPFFLAGKTVSKDIAKAVARNFFIERLEMANIISTEPSEVNAATMVYSKSGEALYYNMEMKEGGFVLVSANDNIIPVLAYSFQGSFDQNYCNVASWMNHYEDQILFAISKSIQPDSKVKAKWEHYLSNIPAKDVNKLSITAVFPLLVSHWNQDAYYNGKCPQDPGGPDGRCYAGCVATAMGQLMYYYRFPEQGQGSYTYVHPTYGTLTANFDTTTYNWTGMPSFIYRPNDPIALMLFHLGVSVDMDYGPQGSGMWNHKAAFSLKNYFRYGPETRYYFRDSISINWDSILIANLDQRKPLYYAGWAGVQSTEGHAFVCDGYQTAEYFHFNWGWGGQSDGYFYLDNLTPGGNNFNYAQEVIPLFPDTLQNTYPSYCQGTTMVTDFRGSIEDGSGWGMYHPNSECKWLISPQNSEFDSIRAIKLTFTKIDTEEGNDIVSVYDGDTITAPLLGTFSGNTLPAAITSSGNKLLIVFQTNNSDNRDGWIADYESLFPVYCSGTTTLTDQSGVIEDGSGNKNYNDNTVCKWRIQPTGAGSVTLSFNAFDLADSLDVLRIFDQATSQMLANYTGNQIPEPVTSYSGKMLIIFSTNKNNVGQGWQGTYSSSLVDIPENGKECMDFNVQPNPAHDMLTIEAFSQGEDDLEVGILTSTGTSILTKNFRMIQGINQFSIDISKLPSSVYVVKLATSKENSSKIILIH